MNATILLLGTMLIFLIAYRVYGRFLNNLFDVSNERQTPAHVFNDGVDYVPTKFPVLFGHHFASIAGAGPIVGPILAGYFGWLPALIWIIIGSIFIGGVHDFASMVVSARNDGHSIGYLVEKYMGYYGRQIFLFFTLAALLLVVAIFSILIAKICTSVPSVFTASCLFILIAPIYGYLVYRKGLSVVKGSFVFVPLLFISVFIGIYYPVDLMKIMGLSTGTVNNIMIIILLIYCFIASIMPVWLLLQPRDYLNSFLLYAMLILALAGILFVSPDLNMKAFNGWEITQANGSIMDLFPMIFVVVACGACSGFHSLVSSGTSSKQVYSEKDMLRVGYGAMLVEGVVAVIALISVAYLTEAQFANTMRHTSPINAFANGIGSMVEEFGISEHFAVVFISLTVSAFMLTTLDTATRLARFTWQEMFIKNNENLKDAEKDTGHKFFGNIYVATLGCVVIAGYLAFSGNGNAIWPVFGASNQLLAALSLLTVTLYLITNKKNYWVSLIPTIFMLIVSLWALIILLKLNINQGEYALITATVFLIIMAIAICIKAGRVVYSNISTDE